MRSSMCGSEWVGYLEHRDEKDLGVFDANVGGGNYTVFGAATGLQGLPWCATFVHAVVNRPDILGRPHPGVRVLQRRIRRRGYWREADYPPQPGDLIFLTNAPERARAEHCGIVEAATGETVTSIEGNTTDPTGHFPPEFGGAVARMTRRRDDPRILGYGEIGGFYYGR